MKLLGFSGTLLVCCLAFCMTRLQLVADEPKQADKKQVIKKGMKLEEALKSARTLGLKPVNTGGEAVVFKDGKGRDWYRLSPLDWKDSLTVLAVRDDKTKAAIVDKIYWTKNWREDYLRPKNQPRNKRIFVDKIDLKPVVKKLGTGTGKAELPKKPDTGNPFF